MKKTKSIPHTPRELLSELQELVAEAEKVISGPLSEHSAEAIRALRARFGAAREQFTDVYKGAKKKVVAGVECTDASIRANPYQSLAIAVVIGLIAGVLLGRRRR
jgi:ElaB/YqjD/DUF883 family membrane-anchored ribosome-binding protein